MAKLRNYEIDAILGTIETKYREKRATKLKNLINTIELNSNEEELLNLIIDYRRYNNIAQELEKKICELYSYLYPNNYRWGWKELDKEQLKKNKADSLLKDDLNLHNIKNELILSNIEGNDISNFIEEILNRYNFND